jgi:REP element-mobilizing transposase RayT
MARPVRIDVAGGWYHVTSRGNERKAIFRDDRDRNHFLELLAESTERFRLRVHAYVLMPNHYHLLVETPQANLSRAIQWLNVSYSVWFNRRHRRVGHLLQGRFKAVVVDRDQWGLSLSRYVHLNPVRIQKLGLDKQSQRVKRAGLGERAAPELVQARIQTLRTYRWSSYRAYAGLAACPDWLTRATVLGLGGKGSSEHQMQAYRRYVEAAVREGLEETPWEQLEGGVVLGSARFVGIVRQYLRGDEREQGGLRQWKARPGFADVVQAVQAWKGEPWLKFRDRHGDVGRDVALYVGRKRCGMTLAELGKAAGGIDYRSVGGAVSKLERRANADPVLATALETIVGQIEKREM